MWHKKLGIDIFRHVTYFPWSCHIWLKYDNLFNCGHIATSWNGIEKISYVVMKLKPTYIVRNTSKINYKYHWHIRYFRLIKREWVIWHSCDDCDDIGKNESDEHVSVFYFYIYIFFYTKFCTRVRCSALTLWTLTYIKLTVAPPWVICINFAK